jgi:RNA polymerase-binding protein DksA
MIENIEQFKKKLLAEKTRLEIEVASVAGPSNVIDETTDADPNEVADKIEEFDSNFAISDDLKLSLNDVQAALDRIEEGTYGVCEVSGKPIELDRLGANPAARTCKEHMND